VSDEDKLQKVGLDGETQVAIHRRNMENPPYPGIRTKKELKDKILIENTKRIVEKSREE